MGNSEISITRNNRSNIAHLTGTGSIAYAKWSLDTEQSTNSFDQKRGFIDAIISGGGGIAHLPASEAQEDQTICDSTTLTRMTIGGQM